MQLRFSRESGAQGLYPDKTCIFRVIYLKRAFIQFVTDILFSIYGSCVCSITSDIDECSGKKPKSMSESRGKCNMFFGSSLQGHLLF
jgi:hypothetical protein